MQKIIVHLPPDYPKNNPQYPSKERLEMAFSSLLPAMRRIVLSRQQTKKPGSSRK